MTGEKIRKSGPEWPTVPYIPVVPHKAVAEVFKIGNL